MAIRAVAFPMALLLVLSACGAFRSEDPGVRSAQVRDTAPDVTNAELGRLVDGMNAFAADLYAALRGQDGNLVFSPASVELALAMTYAGARGRTAAELRDALNLTLPDERLHPAFNALEQALSSRGKDAQGKDDKPFRIRVANAVWLQEGMDVRGEYLDVLGRHYGAGVRLADFTSGPEPARERINEWVSEQTEEKIPELLPSGVIDALTRLVLTNAVYFNAAWESKFAAAETGDGEFTLLDEESVTVPFMRQLHRYPHANGDGWQAVELPYDGGEVAMLVIVPEPGRFQEVEEQSLEPELVRDVLSGLTKRSVQLSVPKFGFSSKLMLAHLLESLGAGHVFDPERADLSGITDDERLYVKHVVHEATIEVDEEGTEAAAATGVVAGVTSAPMVDVELRVDRPFMFAIRDLETGAIVFLGRVLDPRP